MGGDGDGKGSGSSIQESIEWAMLDGLHRQVHRLAEIQYESTKPFNRKSKRKKKQLQDLNERRQLNIQMREALSRSDLHILLDLDEEVGSSSFASLQKAKSLLKHFCQCLEPLVNTDVVPSHWHGQSRKLPPGAYPHLFTLLEYLQSPESPNQKFELVSSSPSSLVLFTLGPGDTLKATRKVMAAFNDFIQRLQLSSASLGELTSPCSPEPAPPEATSYDYQGFGGRFRRQAMAAFQAIFSNISKCDPLQKAKHNVLLQLPCWEDVASGDASDASHVLQMFLTSCTTSSWQETRVQTVVDETPCWKPSLCEAIKTAQNRDTSLELYVREGNHSCDIDDGVVRVPFTINRSPKTNYDGKRPEKLLRQLIDDGVLNRALTPSQRFKLRITQPFNASHRKSLAIKLVFGLLISLESGYAIKTWDSRQVRFLAADGNGESRDLPYVVCEVADEVSRNLLALPELDLLLKGPPPPSPVFTLLAKVLLEIAAGDCSSLEITSPSEVNQDRSNELLELINAYIEDNKDGAEAPSLTSLRLLDAARSCLLFHELHWSKVSLLQNSLGNKQRVNSLEVAQHLVYDEILCKLETNLSPPQSIASVEADVPGDDVAATKAPGGSHVETMSFDCLTSTTSNEPTTVNGDCASAVVALFDDEVVVDSESSEAKWAKHFFKRLKAFRTSCETLSMVKSNSPRRVRIAVIDTGIDLGNPLIQAVRTYDPSPIRPEWCRSWVGGEQDFHDDVGHGTNCAYLAHKAAPDADIYVAKVFSDKKFKLYQAKHIADAITWALNVWEVDIISLSFGLRPPTFPEHKDEWVKIRTSIRDAIDDAGHRIIFAAASNGGLNEPRSFPATCRNAICVHASDGQGNDGRINPAVETDENFMTLGVAIELVEDGKLVYKSGTSFATPIAAGIAASILGIAQRTANLSDSVKRDLKRCDGMRTMFRIMSQHNSAVGYRYVAPWCHWSASWRVTKLDNAWSDIENELYGLK